MIQDRRLARLAKMTSNNQGGDEDNGGETLYPVVIIELCHR